MNIYNMCADETEMSQSVMISSIPQLTSLILTYTVVDYFQLEDESEQVNTEISTSNSNIDKNSKQLRERKKQHSNGMANSKTQTVSNNEVSKIKVKCNYITKFKHSLQN